jgi:hypothetical protein
VTSRIVRTVSVLSLLSVADLFSPAGAGAQDPAPLAPALPATIQVTQPLQPVVALLLQKSATFRRQCVRIAAAPHTRILVVVDPRPRPATGARARATITRHDHGLLRAIIEMPFVGDHAELLAHEFEHVIEQIEGVDLASLSRRGDLGVVRVDDGVYESARARAAGLAVRNEVYGTDPTVKGAARRMGQMLRAIGDRADRDPPRLFRPR